MNRNPIATGTTLARNTIFNVFGRGAPLAIGLITVPVLVDRLGVDRFGIFSLAGVISGYFGVFDLGLGRAVTKYLAEDLAKPKQSDIRKLFWTALGLQISLGLAGTVILISLTSFLVTRVLKTPSHLVEEATLAFVILALSVPMGLGATTLNGSLEAAQRFDKINILRLPFSALDYLIPLLSVLFGLGLPGIVTLLVASRFLAFGLFFFACLQTFPELRAPPKFEPLGSTRLLSYGGWITVSSAIGPLLTYLDRFVLGAVVSIAAVAYYSAPYGAITKAWILPVGLVATLFPALSALGSVQEHERVKQMVSRSVEYLLMAMGPGIALTVALAPDLLELWLGSQFAIESSLTLQILATGVLINSLARVPHALIQSAGRPDVTAKFHLIELLPHAILLWVFVQSMGVPGAALAWTARVTFDAILQFVASAKLTLIPLRQMFSWKVLTGVSAALAVGWLLRVVGELMPTWERLTVALLAFAGLTVAFWIFVLDSGGRSQALRLMRSTRSAFALRPESAKDVSPL